MFCRNCGNQISEGTKFCSNCGMAQEISQPETQDTKIVEQEIQPKLCKNCGVELKDGVKFCSECGTAIETKQAVANTQQPHVSQQVVSNTSNTENTKKTTISKGIIGGFIMIVFGFIAMYGGTQNGMFEKMSTNGADISSIATVLFEVGLIIGGAFIAYKSAKKNNK
ncbi:MAG: zinc-ribbon domain-containing protein [Clostridia bacterium]|nr:zinc-ribbon domain-containing protein [Clostridia bacterium]